MLNCSRLPCDWCFDCDFGLRIRGIPLIPALTLAPPPLKSLWFCSGSMDSILDDVVVAGDNIIETFLGCGLLID